MPTMMHGGTSTPRYHKLVVAKDDGMTGGGVVAGASFGANSLVGRRTVASSATMATRGDDDHATTVVVTDAAPDTTTSTAIGGGVNGVGLGTTTTAATTTVGLGAAAGAAGAATMRMEKMEKSGDGERLWSNLNLTKQPFRHEPGSLPGAIALVAGTTVGAGMLALPAVCQDSGFVPSTAALTGCWFYMISTGLLVLEVNLATMCELGSGGVSIVSMAERTLGKPGTRFAWGAYVFIHYALMVAYISRSGEIVHDATGGLIPAPAAATAYAATLGGGAVDSHHIPHHRIYAPQLVHCFIVHRQHDNTRTCSPQSSCHKSKRKKRVAWDRRRTALLGGFIYAAPSNALENFNNALVAVVLGTFIPLLFIAGAAVEPANLLDHGQWSSVPNTIPVIALAFVFHNVIPVVAATLEGDRGKIRTALVAAGGGVSSVPATHHLLHQ